MDWLIWTIGGSAGLVVLGLVLVVIIGDRSRGRRRCPKCWHSMEGLPERDEGGWVCPECGKAARREKRLYKTRRGRPVKLVLLAVVLAVSGVYGKGVWNRRFEGRPRMWMPTLPAVLLISSEPDTLKGARKDFDEWLVSAIRGRFGSPAFPDWQRDMLAWRMNRLEDERVWRHVHVPRVWLRGEPILISITEPVCGGGYFEESAKIEARDSGHPVTTRRLPTRFWARGSGYSTRQGWQWYVPASQVRLGDVGEGEVVVTAEVSLFDPYPTGASVQQARQIFNSFAAASGQSQGSQPTDAEIRAFAHSEALSDAHARALRPARARIGWGSAISPGTASVMTNTPAPTATLQISHRFPVRFVDSREEVEAAGYSGPAADPTLDEFLRTQPFWKFFSPSYRYALLPHREPVLTDLPPDVWFPVEAELLYKGVSLFRVTRELRAQSGGDQAFTRQNAVSGTPESSWLPDVDSLTFIEDDELAREAGEQYAAWRRLRRRGSRSQTYDPNALAGFTVRYRPASWIRSDDSAIGRHWVPSDGSDYLDVPLRDVVSW